MLQPQAREPTIDRRRTEEAEDGLRQRTLDDPRDADSSSRSSEGFCEAGGRSRWPTKRPLYNADGFFANTRHVGNRRQ